MDLDKQKLQEILNTDILKLAGLENASAAEREEFLQKANETILSEVSRRIEESLPPDKVKEFKVLFDGDAGEEERNSFLQKNIPHLDELFAEAILQFKVAAFKTAHGGN